VYGTITYKRENVEFFFLHYVILKNKTKILETFVLAWTTAVNTLYYTATARHSHPINRTALIKYNNIILVLKIQTQAYV